MDQQFYQTLQEVGRNMKSLVLRLPTQIRAHKQTIFFVFFCHYPVTEISLSGPSTPISADRNQYTLDFLKRKTKYYHTNFTVCGPANDF